MHIYSFKNTQTNIKYLISLVFQYGPIVGKQNNNKLLRLCFQKLNKIRYHIGGERQTYKSSQTRFGASESGVHGNIYISTKIDKNRNHRLGPNRLPDFRRLFIHWKRF